MMFSKLYACIAGIGVFAAVTQAMPVSDAEPDLKTLMSTLPSNDDSFQHVGLDGVVRTYLTNGTVLGYVKLKPTHIVQLLKNYRGTSELAQNLAGVNGHDVTDEKQLFYPGEDLLPTEFKSQGVMGGKAVVKERHDIDDAVVHPVQERDEQQSESRADIPFIISPSQVCYYVKCGNAVICGGIKFHDGGHCSACIQVGNDKSRRCSVF